MESPISILITDDKPQYRKIIKEMLAPYNIRIIAEAENGKELLNLLNTYKPDVVLLDLEMPVMDGNMAFTKISQKFPNLKVIVLSLHFEHILIEDYIERGAKGYIPKDAIMGDEVILINAINKVHAGGIFVFEYPSEKKKYSSRQKEMLPLIFDGKTNEEIAKESGISTRAIEKQRKKIYELNGFEKAMEFYKYAFSKGLQFLGRKNIN